MSYARGSVLEAKVQPVNYKGGFIGYQDRLQVGVLKNPIKQRIMELRTDQCNDFFRDQICYQKTEFMKYYRIIEIFCDSREQ